MTEDSPSEEPDVPDSTVTNDDCQVTRSRSMSNNKDKFENSGDGVFVQLEDEMGAMYYPTRVSTSDSNENILEDRLPVEPPISLSTYIAGLIDDTQILEAIIEAQEDNISNQKRTISELESQITTLETVEPGLETIQQDELPVDQYISSIEKHVENLQSKLNTKDKIITELKEELDKAKTETRENTVSDVVGAMISDVRAPLVRGIEQADGDLSEGVEITISQFDDLVSEHGLTILDPEPGEPVDRDQCEVTQTLGTEYEEGTIAKVYECGLISDGDVVKPVEVAMSEGPVDEDSQNDTPKHKSTTKAETDDVLNNNSENLDKNNEGGESEAFENDTDSQEAKCSNEVDGNKSTDEIQNDATDMSSSTDFSQESDAQNATDEVNTPNDGGSESREQELNLSVETNRVPIGERVQILVTDDGGSSVSGVTIRTDTGKQRQTDESGKVSLIVESDDQISVWIGERSENVDEVTIDISDK